MAVGDIEVETSRETELWVRDPFESQNEGMIVVRIGARGSFKGAVLSVQQAIQLQDALHEHIQDRIERGHT